ncbi:5-(carboxyamino)imidazole ribonucleotide synthase [Scopulibacillus darangshiensis]|uniref:N5-carboxyaminoimidazole ribonucleotide synthase n=1 Tax=Scopulibacillus darangshiensis TaxID=442528 RepID=A0A4R2NQP3_9BACL|nr:5-(carboxyamino)imidazole ribonucleotide synthase [Scopulibacillus darangshiensis]TCP24097.1 5-(carboxyamino)imidazole ribonucleotide synthase [Scopulibacillus darangshiensis]
MKKHILPGETIGILGGGQLGRMMAISAKEMGFRVAVLDPKADNPCAQVSDHAILTDYDDPNGAKQLADETSVITYEFENVDLGTVGYLEKHAFLPQGGELLKMTKDRINEKNTISSHDIAVAPYHPVKSLNDLEEAYAEIGLPAVLKTCQGGYDGKGQYVLRTEADLDDVRPLLNGDTPFVFEKWLTFEKEISVIVTRSTQGETAVFPVAENIHRNNILHHTIVPARISDTVQKKAEALAVKLAEKIDLIGTLAVEMFLTQDGSIYVNECAPRPHNSGHFSINACITSQFRQHIRAICGWPLGSTALLKPVIMVNILGQHLQPVLDVIDQFADVHLHLYGKDEAKTDRKMGHVTILADTVDEAIEKAESLGVWKIKDRVEISK